jgi:ribosomal protein S18 acetylase RimI-like enzyme
MNAGNIRVRAATPQDARLAGKLVYEASLGEAHLTFGRPEPVAKELAIMTTAAAFPLRGHVQSYDHTIVAEQDGMPCGLIMSYNKHDWQRAKRGSYKLIWHWIRHVRPAYIPRFVRFILDMNRGIVPFTDADLYIEYLAVLPEKRNQGIGKDLIQAAADLAKEQGQQNLALDCVISNRSGRRFYDRLGFRCIRTIADKSFTRHGLSGQWRLLRILE